MEGFPKLVVFDMDGLMFDTERLSLIGWRIIGEKNHFKMTQEIVREKSGRSREDVRAVLHSHFGQDVPVEKWHRQANAEKFRLADELGEKIIKPGLVELIDFLDDHHIDFTIASSSRREVIAHYLAITRLSQRFNIDKATAGDEVLKSKPDPEIFMTACRKWSCPPERALVLEDSVSGIAAAASGCIPCIFVEDLTPPDDFVREKAETVCSSLLEVRKILSEKREINFT